MLGNSRGVVLDVIPSAFGLLLGVRPDRYAGKFSHVLRICANLIFLHRTQLCANLKEDLFYGYGSALLSHLQSSHFFYFSLVVGHNTVPGKLYAI